MKKRFLSLLLALALCMGLCAPALAVDIKDAAQEDIKSTFTILRNGTVNELNGRYRSSEPVLVDDTGDGTGMGEIYPTIFGQGDSWTITNTGSGAISAGGSTDYTISFTTWQYGYLPGEGYQWVGGTSTIDAQGNHIHAPDEDTELANLKAGESITISAFPCEGGIITALDICIDYNDYRSDHHSYDNCLYYTFYFLGDDALKTAIDEKTPFTDVPGWCAPAVNWAVDEGITDGTGDNKFSPNDLCKHAEILTFLWRAAGKPNSNAAIPMDISGKNITYAEAALRWAAEKGMINASLDPAARCTRADAVAYIWKAFGEMGVGGEQTFTDVPVDADCFGAVNYAVACGITNGYEDGTFRPGKTCSRGEIVTFLHRAYVPTLR